MMFFIPLLAIFLWSDIFMHNREAFVPLPYSMPAYTFVMKYLTNIIMSGIIALLLIILQAFYLVYINKVYNFISQRTFLTSLLFVLISSAFLNLHYLHPAIIANIFILLTIVEIFSSYRKPKVYKESFNAGFLIAVAGLFYVNANFLIFFVFVSLMILHSFNWREWFAVILGFVTPYLITLFLYYYTDSWSELQLISKAIFEYHSPKLIWPLSYYIFSGILSAIAIISIFKLSTSYSNNKISTRNYFSLFTILLIFVFSIFLVVPFASIELIVILAIPISYLMANYYLSSANKWVQEITFVLLLTSFIFFYIQKYFDIGTPSLF
jgi:hypothetical protein